MFSVIRFSALFLLGTTLSLTSCKKEEDISRNVTFEITGNYTGSYTAVYTANTTNVTTISGVKLPFTKAVTFGDDITGIGFGAAIEQFGQAGQTAVIAIKVDGKTVASGNGTADANGVLPLPTIAYTFK